MDRQPDPRHEDGREIGLPARHRTDESSRELGLPTGEFVVVPKMCRSYHRFELTASFVCVSRSSSVRKAVSSAHRSSGTYASMGIILTFLFFPPFRKGEKKNDMLTESLQRCRCEINVCTDRSRFWRIFFFFSPTEKRGHGRRELWGLSYLALHGRF